MARAILLNVDAGELPDEPEALYAICDILNIACGGHAGDDASMDRVIRAAMANGRSVGAHPSYEDRGGFGRRAMDVTPEALEGQIYAQCKHLAVHAGFLGARVLFVKLHGALYHAADRDREIAGAAIGGAVRALGAEIRVIGPAGGRTADAARANGVVALAEGFCDRATRADGSLVPRDEPGALVSNPAHAAEIARAIRNSVDTVCVHGDTPNALAIARAVRAALDDAARDERGASEEKHA